MTAKHHPRYTKTPIPSRWSMTQFTVTLCEPRMKESSQPRPPLSLGATSSNRSGARPAGECQR